MAPVAPRKPPKAGGTGQHLGGGALQWRGAEPALIFSQCAKDIGLAFIERPEAELATGCIESLKPRWMLPPG